MRKILLVVITVMNVAFSGLHLVPVADAQTTALGSGGAYNTIESAYPSDLIIPSIHLASPIQAVGTTSEGAMAVPSGATTNVGWYKYGTIPGATGSAVLDAHVFAAFAKLKYLKPGSDIYVLAQDGSMRHFVVIRTQTYANANVPLNLLFNRSDGQYLNLITCAGKLTPDHTTYSARLVVYAKIVG
jgi:sortase (surface protein transpeptidase)